MTILGTVVCEHCSRASGQDEILGYLSTNPSNLNPDGAVVAPTVLRDVVGREGTLLKLSCGHSVLKFFFTSSQESLDGIDNSSAQFPVLKVTRAGRER